MAGLLSAVVVAGAQAGVTVCHPGGFYAGLNVGFVAHKAQLKVKENSEVDGTAAKLLAEMKKAKDGWAARVAATQTAYDAAKKENDTKTAAQTKALEAAKTAYTARIVELFKANEAAAGQLGDGTAATGTEKISALTGFAKTLFENETIKKQLNISDPEETLANTINNDETRKKYDAALQTVAAEYAESVFNGTTVAGLTVEKVMLKTGSDKPFGDAIKAKYTTYAAAKDEATKAAEALTAANTALTAEKAKVTVFETALGADKEVKLTDLASDDAVKAKAAAVNKLEINELLANSNGKRSKTKAGFVAEAVFGFDHRIDDMMVGAELFVGFDTSKLTLRDKKVTDARKAGTADKSLKDGVELKRQFYVGIAPRIGYMFTPELEGYFMVGAQLNRYKVDARGMAIVYDHTTNILNQATALNDARAKAITDAKDDDAKKFYEGIHEISTTETFTERNKQYKKHNKTKFAPVIGVGIRYAFTPDVFGTLQYKYQFNTKVTGYNKTGDFQIKDQNHTVTIGVGFRF